MSDPKCAQCGCGDFERTHMAIRGGFGSYYAIHCGRCGAVVSIESGDESRIKGLIEKIARQVKA